MKLINIVTHFGDLLVVLPLAAAVLAWLARLRAPSLIFYWLGSVLGCILVTTILKIYFLSCPSGSFDLRSPSGHASLSVLVYGALGTIAAKAARGTARAVAIGAAAGLIALIALSRALLGAHSTPEIALGLALGGGALAPFSHRYLRIETRAPFPTRLLLAAAILLPLVLAMDKPDTEKLLGSAAAALLVDVPACTPEPQRAQEAAQ